MTTILRVVSVVVLVGACREPSKPPPSAPQAAAPAIARPRAGDLGKVGRVELPIACEGKQIAFDRALALLHSFFYDEARRQFTAIAATDPG